MSGPRGERALRLALLLTVTLMGCGEEAIPCTGDSFCVVGELRGRCVAAPGSGERFCAYPDTGCADGERWSSHAASGLAGTCVGAEGGLDLAAPDLTVDVDDLASPPDLPPGPDLAKPDASRPVDLSTPMDLLGSSDRTLPPDLTPLPDLTSLPDLTLTPDLTPTPDLTLLPDLAMPVTPSHVPMHYISDGACDLTVTSTIDTTSGNVDGQVPPSGCITAVETIAGSSLRVLAVRNFVINGPATVRVTGTMPLVVVAGGTIVINGVLDGSAVRFTPGPGGAMPGLGTGQGTQGMDASPADTGGGGAGYGFAGGRGGDVNGIPVLTGPPGGPAYPTGDNNLVNSLPAGSGGGGGAVPPGGCAGAPSFVRGGAGGGALQLTAGGSIIIGGRLIVGGGGGTGGCPIGAGGGGGSGGTLFLEAPVLTVNGTATLAANGGGGGSGGTGLMGGNIPGLDGQDGLPSAQPATGGPSPGIGSSAGGNGGARGVQPTAGGAAQSNSGGGGGSQGRIVLRGRGAPMVNGAAVVSPAAILRTDL